MNNSFDQALKLIEKKLAQDLDDGSKMVFAWLKNLIVEFKNHSNHDEKRAILRGNLLRVVEEKKLFIIQKLKDLVRENFQDITDKEKNDTINFLRSLISQEVNFRELDRAPEEPSLPVEAPASSEEASEPVEEPEIEDTISFDPNSPNIDEVISADIIAEYNKETKMLAEIIAINERMMTRENISEKHKSILQNRIKIANQWLDYYDKKYALMVYGSTEYKRKNASINTQEPILKSVKFFINRRSKKIEKIKAKIATLTEDQIELRAKINNNHFNQYSLNIRYEKVAAVIKRLRNKKGKIELKQRTIVNKKLTKQLKAIKTIRYELLDATKRLGRIDSREDTAKKNIRINTIKLRKIADKDPSEITVEEEKRKKDLLKRIGKLQREKSSLSRNFKFQLVTQNFLFKIVGKSKPTEEKKDNREESNPDETYEEDASLPPPTPPDTPIIETPMELPREDEALGETIVDDSIDSSRVAEPSTPIVSSEPITTDEPISDLLENPAERHRRSDRHRGPEVPGMRMTSPKPVTIEAERVVTSTPIAESPIELSRPAEPSTPTVSSEPTKARVDRLRRLRASLEKYQESTNMAPNPSNGLEENSLEEILNFSGINEESGPRHGR